MKLLFLRLGKSLVLRQPFSHGPVLPKWQPCFHSFLWDEKKCFLALFFKSKNNVNVNMVTLTEITFSEALSFSIMGERRRFLFHTETTKLQPNNFFPKCVDYNMHLK